VVTQEGNIREQKKTSQFWYDIAEWEEGGTVVDILETRWRHLWESVPDHILEIDTQGTILLINKVLPQYEIKNVIGSSVFSYVPDHHHEALRKAITDALETREMHQYEIPTFAGGATTWWTNRIVPLIHNNAIVTLLIIATNVTSIKEKEQELSKQNLQLKALNKELKTQAKKLRFLEEENTRLKAKF